jgi:hypothetical protein
VQHEYQCHDESEDFTHRPIVARLPAVAASDAGRLLGRNLGC